jgi:hypothetical protein
MTKITLSDKDAALFLEFQEHYQTFSTLRDSGVFEIRNGIAQLNFDSNGTITDIDCNFKLFKRGLPVLVDLHIVR